MIGNRHAHMLLNEYVDRYQDFYQQNKLLFNMKEKLFLSLKYNRDDIAIVHTNNYFFGIEYSIEVFNVTTVVFCYNDTPFLIGVK